MSRNAAPRVHALPTSRRARAEMLCIPNRLSPVSLCPRNALPAVMSWSVVLLSLAGCATLDPRRAPLTPDAVPGAQVGGYQHVRFWGDEASPAMRAAIEDHYREIKTAAAKDSALSVREADFLALSGGGSDGAFGAGLLKGWSDRGDRPEFEVVTGISTGALAAPFAFLGSDYDSALTEIYTTYSDNQLFTSRGPMALLSDSLDDTTPLKHLIERYITPAVIEAVAAEGRKGRRLLIETTDLDAQRPVIWDLTEVAASTHRDKRALFIKLMLASSAIPAVFPAQRIAVTSDGQTFDELHVDGGVSAQIFFAPPQMKLGDEERKIFGHTRRRTLYAIRNGKLVAEYHAVEDETFPIAKRAIATMIKNQGRANIAALARSARDNGARMFYAAVPADFQAVSHGEFDPAYMSALYQVGRTFGKEGVWIDPATQREPDAAKQVANLAR